MIELESEAWSALADTMEMIEGMVHYRDGTPTAGLCAGVVVMFHDHIISSRLHNAMLSHIDRRLQGGTWLAYPGSHELRIGFAREFAEKARKQEKRK